MKQKTDRMPAEQVNKITFWQPITLDKAERILSYFKGKADKVGGGRIYCLDHIMAGIDVIRPNNLLVDRNFIDTQIAITQWVVDALEAGEKITDFRLFYEKKYDEHTKTSHFA